MQQSRLGLGLYTTTGLSFRTWTAALVVFAQAGAQMKRLIWLTVMLGCCATSAELKKDLTQATAQVMDCPVDMVTVTCKSSCQTSAGGHSWKAAACGRVYSCHRRVQYDSPKCTETHLSRQRVLQRAAVYTLAQETGCVKEKIRVVSRAQPSSGNEPSLRIHVCGVYYVCTPEHSGANCNKATP